MAGREDGRGNRERRGGVPGARDAGRGGSERGRGADRVGGADRGRPAARRAGRPTGEEPKERAVQPDDDGARQDGDGARPDGDAAQAPRRRSIGRRAAGGSAGGGSARAQRLLGLSSTRRAAVLALIVCAVVLSVAVPLRNYLAQRGDLQDTVQQQDQLREQVDGLERRKAQLSDPAQVEVEARNRLRYVHPGETPYVVQLPSETPEPAPGEAPRDQ